VAPVPVDVERYQQMLGLNLEGIGVVSMNRQTRGVKGRLARVPGLRRYRDLAVSAQAAKFTSRYDLLISMVYGLPAISRARRSVMLCQFPYDRNLKLGRPGVPPLLHGAILLPYRLARRLALGRELNEFELIICQSEYVRHWIRELWERDSTIVYPPVDVPSGEPDLSRKGPVILSVGRFFASGHAKRHDVMAEAFRRLCDGGLSGWELHLAGSLHRKSSADAAYFERIQELADGYPIHLHPDAPRQVVVDLYERASIYWHAAGYGADERTRPAELEHFGMTTVEAMGRGAVPVAIARGGQVEVVEDGTTGYLWQDLRSLAQRTLELIEHPELRARLGAAARLSSHRFSEEMFRRQMAGALSPILDQLGGKSS
jgi:glycosyltransferase involved in cell wall biosynthesis